MNQNSENGTVDGRVEYETFQRKTSASQHSVLEAPAVVWLQTLRPAVLCPITYISGYSGGLTNELASTNSER